MLFSCLQFGSVKNKIILFSCVVSECARIFTKCALHWHCVFGYWVWISEACEFQFFGEAFFKLQIWAEGWKFLRSWCAFGFFYIWREKLCALLQKLWSHNFYFWCQTESCSAIGVTIILAPGSACLLMAATRAEGEASQRHTIFLHEINGGTCLLWWCLCKKYLKFDPINAVHVTNRHYLRDLLRFHTPKSKINVDFYSLFSRCSIPEVFRRTHKP